MIQHYSKKEALNRIYMQLRGDTLSSEQPETVPPPVYSEDEAVSRIAELLADNLEGEMFVGNFADLHASSARIGSATNNVGINTIGWITFNGTARFYEVEKISPTSMKVGTGAYPDWSQWKTDGAGSKGIYLYWFDKDEQQDLYFSAQLPQSYDHNTDITPQVLWTPKSDITGTVTWGVEIVTGDIGEDFTTNTFLLHGSTSGGAGGLKAGKVYETTLESITGSVYSLASESVIVGRVFRDASGTYGVDDYGDDVGMVMLNFEFVNDTVGG